MTPVNKILATLFVALCGLLSVRAADRPATLKTDSLANVLIKDGKYEDAIKMLNRTVSALDENNPDSVYIVSFVKMGYCYDRLENPMKAIEMTKLAIFLRESAGMPENLSLANLFDNIALGYYKLEQNSEAYDWCQKALLIVGKYPNATEACIRYFSHASMILKALGQFQDAIDYQQRVVGLVADSKGKYSELHIEHLTTLRTLYNASGDSVGYSQASSLIKSLRDEIAVGVQPAQTDLSTPRLCRQHNTDALLCCRWILGNYVTTAGMKNAVDYLTQFYRHTPDVAVYLGKAENQWIGKLNSVYLVAYIAASCDYALRHPDDLRYSLLQYRYAINKVLDYYAENKQITGTIPTLDSYLRQRDNSPEKFNKTLSRNFADFCNQMRTKRPYEFEVEVPTIMQFSY